MRWRARQPCDLARACTCICTRTCVNGRCACTHTELRRGSEHGVGREGLGMAMLATATRCAPVSWLSRKVLPALYRPSTPTTAASRPAKGSQSCMLVGVTPGVALLAAASPSPAAGTAGGRGSATAAAAAAARAAAAEDASGGNGGAGRGACPDTRPRAALSARRRRPGTASSPGGPAPRAPLKSSTAQPPASTTSCRAPATGPNTPGARPQATRQARGRRARASASSVRTPLPSE